MYYSMAQLKQWIITVVLAGLIAAIGTIVFVAMDDGSETTTTTPVNSPIGGGDTNPQPPIIIDGTPQAPLTPSTQNTPIPTQVFNPTATTPPTTNYTVQPGDTLYNIAIAYGTTVDEIVRLSNLQNPDNLVVGQILTVPAR